MGAAPHTSASFSCKGYPGHIVTIFSDSNMVENPKQQIK